jgi:CBS domain-containing protein
MSTDVQSVAPDQSIQEAARFMLSVDAGALPVVQDQALRGMITDRDIAVRAVAQGRGPQTPVRDVMTGDALFVLEDASLEDAADLMSDHQVRRLAVKARDGDRLIGIISLADITRANDMDAAGATLDDISRPGGEHNQSSNE